jgi:hypothetical protein
MRLALLASLALLAACAERSPFQAPGDVIAGYWPFIRSLVVHGDYLYAGTATSTVDGARRRARIERMHKAGGDIDVLFESTDDEASIIDLSIAGETIYFVTRRGEEGSPQAAGTISSMPLAGGEATELASDVSGACAVVANDTHVYWSAYDASGTSPVFYRRLHATGVITARPVSTERACHFLVGPVRLYYQEVTGSNFKLYGFPLDDDGAAPVQYGVSNEGPTSPDELVNDPWLAFLGNDTIVWATTGGFVYASGKDTGVEQRNVSGDRHHRVLTSGDDIYLLRSVQSGSDGDVRHVTLSPLRSNELEYQARQPRVFALDDDYVYVPDEKSNWLVRVPR